MNSPRNGRGIIVTKHMMSHAHYNEGWVVWEVSPCTPEGVWASPSPPVSPHPSSPFLFLLLHSLFPAHPLSLL
jgi:hypothetical protein